MNDPALDRILELEAALEDAHIIIDLQREEVYELKTEVARLKEALKEFKLQHRSDLVA